MTTIFLEVDLAGGRLVFLTLLAFFEALLEVLFFELLLFLVEFAKLADAVLGVL